MTGVVPQDELPLLIEAVVSNVAASDLVKFIRTNGEAKKFVNVLDEVHTMLCFVLEECVILSSARRYVPLISRRGSVENA